METTSIPELPEVVPDSGERFMVLGMSRQVYEARRSGYSRADHFDGGVMAHGDAALAVITLAEQDRHLGLRVCNFWPFHGEFCGRLECV